MRISVLTAALLALMPFSAQAFDDPKSLVQAIYAPYVSGQKHPSLEPFYSERLKTLFAANLQAQAVDETGAPVDPDAAAVVQFDPFIEGTGTLLLDLSIGDPVISGDRAMASVSFHNFDHPSLLSVAMVHETDGWKVDDIASLGGGENWLLSWLLQYDPFAVK